MDMENRDRQRRKALKAQAAQKAPERGVLCVHCLDTGRRGVIAAHNLHNVMQREKFLLRTGSHGCAQLQQDWQTYGEDAFEFIPLERWENEREDPNEDYDARLLQRLDAWQQKLRDEGYALYSWPRSKRKVHA